MNQVELRLCVSTKNWAHLNTHYTRLDLASLRLQMDGLGLNEWEQARVLVDSGLVAAPYCGIDDCPCCMTIDELASMPGFELSSEFEHSLTITLPAQTAADLINTFMYMEWIPGSGIVFARQLGSASIVIEEA